MLSRALSHLGHTAGGGRQPGRCVCGGVYPNLLELAVGEDGDEGFCLGGQHGSHVHQQQSSHSLSGHHPGAGQVSRFRAHTPPVAVTVSEPLSLP